MVEHVNLISDGDIRGASRAEKKKIRPILTLADSGSPQDTYNKR